MPRENISFKTSDNVTLKGWLFTPDTSSTTTSTQDPTSSDQASPSTTTNTNTQTSTENENATKYPCIVMAHGFSALKEMDLDAFAEYFCANLPVACLVYDNRGFGESECAKDAPVHEIVPSLQCSDYTDAITYAQSLPNINPSRIAIWGSSYSGGHVLAVGAVDRRVKCVLSQVPCVDGYANFQRLIRPDYVAGLEKMFEEDRLARAAGKDPGRLPVVDADPTKPSALPTPDSYEFFSAWEKKSGWKNDVTVKTIELFRAYNPAANIHRLSPTPLLLTVAENDVLTPTDLAIEAFHRAREPKKLSILPGGHFEAYTGRNFLRNAGAQVAWLREWFVGRE